MQIWAVQHMKKNIEYFYSKKDFDYALKNEDFDMHNAIVIYGKKDAKNFVENSNISEYTNNQNGYKMLKKHLSYELKELKKLRGY